VLLRFTRHEGKLRNYFYRQGPVAAHVVTRSGSEPRILIAFPAGNQGIGTWFQTSGTAELSASELRGVIREQGGLDSVGVRAHVASDARTLTASITLLGNVRTLRDYGYGLCLEDAARFPELRNETVELDHERRTVRIRREQVGGRHTLELLLEGRAGTSFALVDAPSSRRPQCAAPGGGQKALRITSATGIELELTALSDETPLTPVDTSALFAGPPPDDSAQADALAFLSYEEKLLAGSWRFLTYFGRDTLLSLRLLMPALASDFVERALGSVIERINLDPGARDATFGAIEPGEVAHEEAIGDYAALGNSRERAPPADLRTPRYDYKMVDDDFLLAPVLEQLFEKQQREEPAAARTKHDVFLARVRPDGRTYHEAIAHNLALVLARARPFGEDGSPSAQKKSKLVALKPGLAVGEWRDSEMGLGFGRYPFDVNVALVPGALGAAAALYRRLNQLESALSAERLLARWQGVEELFRVDTPAVVARARVSAYAKSLGIADASSELDAEPDGVHRFYGIALDANGAALPVMHSDDAFVLELTRPSEAYLVRVARALARRFPAGLTSNVGLLVANPAFAPGGAVVPSLPGVVTTAAGHDARRALRDLFTRSHYHGTVVWSWQQALLASGLRRQLERADLTAATRSALEAFECKLWHGIQANAALGMGELWSWEADTRGGMVPRAFGDVRADVDESNAIQLWSTVYLAVRAPGERQNPLCQSLRRSD
jgi:hypothetical protein